MLFFLDVVGELVKDLNSDISLQLTEVNLVAGRCSILGIHVCLFLARSVFAVKEI